MADSSLNAIRKKARLLARVPGEPQLTTAELDNYINTFILYDFPEKLRLFNLKTTFSFYTMPYVSTYSTRTDVNSPLYNFENKYITTDAPIYIGGYQALFSQSREQFYNLYPKVNTIASIGSMGDGVEDQFEGIINLQQQSTPLINGQNIVLLPNNVLFSSVDINNNGLAMQDTPIIDATTKNPTNYGILYNALTTNTQSIYPAPSSIPNYELTAPYFIQPGFPLGNYINYITGEFRVTFDTPPQAGAAINSQTVQNNPTIPQALLFFDGEFTVRPIPDQPYRIEMEVFMQPTELLQGTQTPQLSEWFQYIAFQVAKKIFEDKSDFDSVQQLLPAIKEQELLINRRTIVQQSSQRSSTIYTNQTGVQGSYGPGSFWGGN